MLRTASKYLLPLAALLAGCSTSTPKQPVAQPGFTSGLHGSVHGGQQPITGATIQLYQVGSTGDGSSATSILNAPYNTSGILTDSNGGFDLTGKFNCPTQTTLVYLVATGGNPGLPPPFNNPNSILIAALGQCGNPTNITFINLNEVTTVAAVYALASYMTSPTAIGSGSSDTQALASAFTLAWEFADVTTGLSPGSNVPTGTTIPTAQINTLANLISACVNSAGGVATDTSTLCGQLFSLTTPASTAPTDTTTALLNLAKNPSLNTQALYNLVLPAAPFQPAITQQPPDFGVRPTVPFDFTVSPSSLTFGTALIGNITAAQDVAIMNNTTHAIAITNTLIVGSNPSDFLETVSSVQPNSCNEPTPPGEVCHLSVFFNPTAAGLRHAYLVVKNDSPNPFISVALSGTGIVGTAGPVTISPQTLTSSLYNTPQPVTLTNAGNTALSITSIRFSSSNGYPGGGPYTETDNCGTSLPAQSICTIQVTLHSSNGTDNTMTVADDAATGPQIVTLVNSINHAYGQIPDSFDFGTESVGTTSSLVSVGAGVSWPGTIGLQLSGPNASDFSITSPFGANLSNGGCSFLNRTDSCYIQMNFQPSGLGLRTATVTAANLGTFQVTGTGVGAGPYFEAAPTNLITGAQFGSSDTLTIPARYTGTVVSNINPPVVTGPHAAEFTSASTCQNGTLGGTCTLSITFTPAAPGESFTAPFTISEATNTVQKSFTLTASSGGSTFTLSPSQLTFPSTLAGTISSPMSTTVTAITNNPITATVNGYFQITSGSICLATPCQVSVAFAPAASSGPGTATGSLTLKDSYTGLQTSVYLTGTVTTQTPVNVSPGSLTFPLRTVNTTSIPQTITVSNIGTSQVLTFTSVSLTGANPGDYILTNNCTSNVTPGNSCTINVSFAPTAPGTRTATLNIVSNSTTSPDTVSLSGTAQ